MKQLFNIFTITSNQSEVHDRITATENNLQSIFDAIKQLKDDNKNLKQYANEQMDKIRE